MEYCSLAWAVGPNWSLQYHRFVCPTRTVSDCTISKAFLLSQCSKGLPKVLIIIEMTRLINFLSVSVWPPHGKASARTWREETEITIFSPKLCRTLQSSGFQNRESLCTRSPYQLRNNQAPREDHRTVGSTLTSVCSKNKMTFRCLGYWEIYREFIFRAVEYSNLQSASWKYLQGKYADPNKWIFQKPKGQLQHTEYC